MGIKKEREREREWAVVQIRAKTNQIIYSINK